MVCLAWDSRTREYAARRTKQGQSTAETIRCLKRYVAREVYRCLATTRPSGRSRPPWTTARVPTRPRLPSPRQGQDGLGEVRSPRAAAGRRATACQHPGHRDPGEALGGCGTA